MSIRPFRSSLSRELSALDSASLGDWLRYFWNQRALPKWMRTPLRAVLRGPAFVIVALLLRWADRRAARSAGHEQTSRRVGDHSPAEDDAPRQADGHDHGQTLPSVSTTTAGVRVVDKRRVPREQISSASNIAQTADQRSSGASTSDPDDGTAPVSEPVSLKESSVVWCRLIGRLITAAARRPIPTDLTSEDLGRIAWTERPCRVVLQDTSPGDISPCEIAALVSRSGIGDWRLPVRRWIERHVESGRLVDLLQSTLLQGDITAVDDRMLTLCLRLCGKAAASLPDEAAGNFLTVALQVAGRPLDPYRSHGAQLVARAAVVDLLKARPELDSMVHRRLTLTRPEVPAETASDEAELLAIAIRDRAADGGASFQALAVAANLSPAALDALAGLADAPLRRPAHIRSAELPGPLSTAVGMIRRWLVPWVFPPALCVTAGLLTRHWRWAAPPASAGLSDAIVALTLLASVNVFTVQLSAQRLPGIVARTAGQPAALYVSYSAVFSVLTASLIKPKSVRAAAAVQWASTSGLALFLAALLVALFTLFGRTDAGRAAQGFVDTTLTRARASGRRLGRIQARAIDLRTTLSGVPAVRLSSDNVVGEWAEAVEARARGFFLPSRRSLRELLAQPQFAGGMRLRLIAGMGTIVNEGSDIAFLIPTARQTVSRRLASCARRSLRTRRAGPVEETATGVVALIKLALDLAAGGDRGTAHAVAQNVNRLIAAHAHAAKEARRAAIVRQTRSQRARAHGKGRNRDSRLSRVKRASDDEVVPVVPAIRDAIQLVVRTRLDARSELRDVPEEIVSAVLAASGRAEAAAVMLVTAIPNDVAEIQASSTAATELLRLAGIRALETNDAVVFRMVIDKLDAIAKSGSAGSRYVSDAVGVCSVLGATACRFDSRRAREAVDAVVAMLDRAEASGISSAAVARMRMFGLWRIGGASLVAASPSVAIYLVRKLNERSDHSTLVAASSDRDLLTREAAQSTICGGYLGDSGMDALANFGSFVDAMQPHLASA